MVARGIKPSEIDLCLDVLDKSFESTSRDYFKRYFYGDPWFKPEYTVVCDDDGKLVSTVQICRREVRYGTSTLTLGGIANVGTPPDSRGKGYSSEALKYAVEVMAKDGMDFSTLYTGINAFYERVGYSTVEFSYGAGALLDQPKATADGYVIRDYTDSDAEAVVAVYNEFNSDVTMSVVRTTEYWRNYAINPLNSRQQISVAETSEGVVAYIAGLPYGKSYSLSEMGCRSGHEAALQALASKVLDRAREAGLAEVIHRLPDKEAVISAVNSISTPVELRKASYLMFRVLNLQSMVKKMLPELTTRSAGLRGEGTVTLSVECAGDVTLTMAQGKVEVLSNPVDTRLNLTQWQFVNLVFGYQNPLDILPKRPESDLLAVLFPEDTAVYYNIDGF